jgi:heme/copper-type cytochrome/quinol oxidase subunit 4
MSAGTAYIVGFVVGSVLTALCCWARWSEWERRR